MFQLIVCCTLEQALPFRLRLELTASQIRVFINRFKIEFMSSRIRFYNIHMFISYLGPRLNFLQKDIDIRIAISWFCFKNQYHLEVKNSKKKCLKVQIFRLTVETVVLYVWTSWTRSGRSNLFQEVGLSHDSSSGESRY